MDIVEQLRKSANIVYKQDGYTFRLGLQNEAADEIERLRKVIIKITHHIDDNQSGLFIKTFALAALKEGE